MSGSRMQVSNGASDTIQKSDTMQKTLGSHGGRLKLSERGYKLFLRAELVGLCVLIGVVWALLAIPVFLFHLSPIDEDVSVNISAVRGGEPGFLRHLNDSNNTDTCQFNCSTGFYCSGGVVCLPSCDWKEIPQDSSDLTDVLVRLLVAVGVIVGIIVIVISCIRRKRMFRFPSVLIIYHNITWLLIGMTVLISLSDRDALYCVSDDLIESIITSSGFCVFTGVVFYYGLLQLLTWWICHVTILFWKIKFPFQARSFDQSNRTKYIHIACILISLFLPLVPILITIGNNLDEPRLGTVGFTMTRFPPLLCTSIDSNATFYALVLPVILILDTGLALLIIMLWFIHKQTVRMKADKDGNPLKLGTAEKKLLVIIVYYVLLAVLALTTFTIFSQTLPLFMKRLFEYFTCEQTGSPESAPCDTGGFQDLTNPIPANMSFVLLAVNPWLNLVFALNIRELKELLCPYVQRTKSLLIRDQSSITTTTSDKTNSISHNSNTMP